MLRRCRFDAFLSYAAFFICRRYAMATFDAAIRLICQRCPLMLIYAPAAAGVAAMIAPRCYAAFADMLLRYATFLLLLLLLSMPPLPLYLLIRCRYAAMDVTAPMLLFPP